MSIGIFYDTLLGKGGAERVVVQLANELGAEIVTSGYNEKRLIVKPIHPVHDLGNMTVTWFAPIGYLFEAPFRFFLNRRKYSYDIEIYMGYTSIYGAKKKANSLWYCFTPNRILYDLRRQRLASQNIVGKAAIYVHILLFSAWDKRCVKRFKTVVCQTLNVQARVRKYYHLDSTVIYSPVDTFAYKPGKDEGYFLAVSRLFPEKRMVLIAEAFVGHKQRLVLVGDGPEKARIQKIADQNSNITLRQNLAEDELRALYENCRATVYMPVDEDYGLVPLEGMAAGKPSIAANEGGCKETVLDGETGLLVESTVQDIRRAVSKLTERWCAAHKSACIEQARNFDIGHVVKQWKGTLTKLEHDEA